MDDDAEDDFREWAVSRAPALHRTAYLLCGDWQVAEDLVQETLARACLNWSRVRRMDHPDAYVRKVLVNQSRIRWRRRSSRELTSSELSDRAVDDGAQQRAERAALMAALASLPARQRAVVVLRYFEQLSEAETAQALGCAAGTVKSQSHRALATLRRLLTEEEPWTRST